MDTEARAARATQRLKAVTYKLNDTERALATTVSEATNAQDQFTETVDQTEEAVASLQSATERAEQLREAAAAQDKRLRELLRLTQEQEAQLDEIAEETKTKKNAAKVGIRGRVGLCGGAWLTMLACLLVHRKQAAQARLADLQETATSVQGELREARAVLAEVQTELEAAQRR